MKYFIFILILLFDLVFFDEYDDIPEDALKYIESTEICNEAEDNRDLCFSKSSSLNIPNYQCCIIEDEGCSLLGGSIEEVEKQMNSQKIKALFREFYGFLSFNFDVEDSKFIKKYDCKDGKTEVKYGYEEYNSADKDKLKSNKHCLRYFYSYSLDDDFKEKFPTDNDCYNADLLQTSKDAGLKCGYGEFNIKFQSGKSEIYKTCYFFNLDSINTKSFDDRTIGSFEEFSSIIAGTEGENLLSYTIALSDDNGNRLSYDSLTRQVTTPSSKSSSEGIKDYKNKFLLFLLILILF